MEVDHIVWLDDYTNRNEVEDMLVRSLRPNEGRLRECVRGIKDFWLTLELSQRFGGIITPPRWNAYGYQLAQELGITVYRVDRYETEGQSALVQTVRWLERRGIKNPVVWNNVQ